MPLGIFDFSVAGILVLFNILFWNSHIQEKTGCILMVAFGILFGFLLPYISSYIEVIKSGIDYGNFDSTDLLYNLFIYPIYWIVGFIQTIMIGYKAIPKENEEIDNV